MLAPGTGFLRNQRFGKNRKVRLAYVLNCDDINKSNGLFGKKRWKNILEK